MKQNNYDKKYENDIYKALGLDKVFESFNKYKQNYLGDCKEIGNYNNKISKK